MNATAPSIRTAADEVRAALPVVDERFAARARLLPSLPAAQEELDKRKHELRTKRLFSGGQFSQADSTAAVVAATEKLRALQTQQNEANTACTESLLELWEKTTAAIDTGKAEALAGVERPERVTDFLAQIASIESDLPVSTLDRLNNINDRFKSWELEQMHRQTVKRAMRVLAVVEEFLQGGAA